MRRALSAFVLSGCIAWLLHPGLKALADEQAAPPKPAANLTEAQVDKLIEQLDDAEFDLRESATRQLIAAGESVVDKVAAAAEGDNLERATRSIAVLKGLFESGNEEAKASAGIALKRLCDSKKPSVARRASAIIKPPEPEGNLVPGVRVDVRGLGINVVPGRRVQMQMANQNGRVEVNVEEDNRKVRITHTNGKEIVVRVTEPPGKGAKGGKTSEYKARDLDELKKKHPEIAPLYEKYSSGGKVDAFGQAIVLENFVPQFAVPLPPGLPFAAGDPARRKAAAAQLQEASSELARLAGKLKELAARPDAAPEELKKLADQIDAAARKITDTADKVAE
jgi:hypothetical protein